MEEVDYRALLVKYIEHVAACEGVDFIDHLWISDVEFTAAEAAALEAASQDSRSACSQR